MKKRIKLMVCIILVVVFFVGCERQVTAEEETTEEETTHTSLHEDFTAENHSVYELGVGESAFDAAIKNNPIDHAYQEEIDRVDTVGEMIEIEQKYIAAWQDELDRTIEEYTTVLSENDKAAFNNSQSAFDDYIYGTFEFDWDVLHSEQYNIQIGTASGWLYYLEMRNAIRERTIHVKYLHFLVERAAGVEGEYISLSFLK